MLSKIRYPPDTYGVETLTFFKLNLDRRRPFAKTLFQMTPIKQKITKLDAFTCKQLRLDKAIIMVPVNLAVEISI